MKSAIHLLKPFLDSSSKSRLTRAVYTLKFVKRPVQDSCKTKPVKCLKKKIWSISGIYLKSTYLSQMTELSVSTMISLYLFLLAFHLSAVNSSAQVLSWSLSAMNLVVSRLSPSSIMLSEKSTYSKHASKSLSMTRVATDISKKKI